MFGKTIGKFCISALLVGLGLVSPRAAQAQEYLGPFTIQTFNTNGGQFIVTGGGGDDRVGVQRTGARQYYVAVYDANGNQTAANYYNVNNFDVNSLTVATAGGNDFVIIGRDPTWTIRNLTIYGGDGDDGVQIFDERINSRDLNSIEYSY